MVKVALCAMTLFCVAISVTDGIANPTTKPKSWFTALSDTHAAVALFLGLPIPFIGIGFFSF